MVKELPLLKWQVFREAFEIAAENDWVLTDRLKGLANAIWEHLISTLPCENGFNDLRNFVSLHNKNDVADPLLLQCTTLKSMTKRLEGGMPTMDLDAGTFLGPSSSLTRFKDGRLSKSVFLPDSVLHNQQVKTQPE